MMEVIRFFGAVFLSKLSKFGFSYPSIPTTFKFIMNILLLSSILLSIVFNLFYRTAVCSPLKSSGKFGNQIKSNFKKPEIIRFLSKEATKNIFKPVSISSNIKKLSSDLNSDEFSFKQKNGNFEESFRNGLEELDLFWFKSLNTDAIYFSILNFNFTSFSLLLEKSNALIDTKAYEDILFLNPKNKDEREIQIKMLDLVAEKNNLNVEQMKDIFFKSVGYVNLNLSQYFFTKFNFGINEKNHETTMLLRMVGFALSNSIHMNLEMYFDRIRWCLRNGADVNIQGRYGRNVLHKIDPRLDKKVQIRLNQLVILELTKQERFDELRTMLILRLKNANFDFEMNYKNRCKDSFDLNWKEFLNMDIKDVIRVMLFDDFDDLF